MKDLISIDEFCSSHQIEYSFISSLQDYGLIEITTVSQMRFIDENQLEQLEKIMRLYNDLGINLEGIDTITHLLQRISAMQAEITALRNRLSLYEDDEGLGL